MGAPEADERNGAAGGRHELPQDGRPSQDAQHPDNSRPRGNPDIERIDLERGLGKIERVSGN